MLETGAAELCRNVALAGLALCLSAAGAAAQSDAVSRAQVLAALPKLEAMANEIVANGGVPGLAVAVVHEDAVVYVRGFGLRESGKPETVDGDTVFQLASMSKPVSATIVAALVSEGVVSWDSRIADLDPSFQLFEAYPTAQLTVRDLLSHRSGLPGTAGDELEAIGFGGDEVRRRLRLVPPSSSFRAGYSYSNAGFTAGAVAAVKPTGKPWATIADEVLYRPLGMNATSSRHADFLARANRAALHIRFGGAWAAKLTRQPDVQAPAGGVSSSARDIAQWLRLELADGVFDGKRLVAHEAIAQTHVPLIARGDNPVTGAASFYGLGWNVEFGRHGLSWGHAGAFSVGAHTLVTLYPKAKLGIVVLTNAFPTGVPEGLAENFFDVVFDGGPGKDWVPPWNAVFEGLFGPVVAAAQAAYARPPDPPSPPLPLERYAGRYENDYLGTATVARAGDGLMLALGPKGARTHLLRHFDRDLFLAVPDAETPDRSAAVRFAIGPDGRAAEVVIEWLDEFGLGTLKRADR